MLDICGIFDIIKVKRKCVHNISAQLSGQLIDNYSILTFVVIVNLVIKSFCIIVAGNFGASYGKEP